MAIEQNPLFELGDSMAKNLRILSAGRYLPEKVITNHDLERIVDTSDEWIFTRTGIRERRIANDTSCTSDLAAKALLDACDKCGLEPDELDAIVVATGTPDRLFPSTAARLHGMLRLKKEVACFDVLAACAGFSYGIEVARGLASLGYRYIGLVGSEVLSKFVDWKDRSTCVLFGDGAGALILESSDCEGFFYGRLYTDGSLERLLEIPGGGSMLPCGIAEERAYKIRMNGREVFKYAVSELSSALVEALTSTCLSPDDIEAVFVHQANMRIVTSVLERAGIPMEKSINNIERYGNTSSASIPILVSEYLEETGFKKGKNYAFLSFGAGFVWGIHLYRHC